MTRAKQANNDTRDQTLTLDNNKPRAHKLHNKIINACNTLQ